MEFGFGIAECGLKTVGRGKLLLMLLTDFNIKSKIEIPFLLRQKMPKLESHKEENSGK